MPDWIWDRGLAVGLVLYACFVIYRHILPRWLQSQDAHLDLVTTLKEQTAAQTAHMVRHTEMLDSHGDALDKHGEVLMRHGEVLVHHGNVLARIETHVADPRCPFFCLKCGKPLKKDASGKYQPCDCAEVKNA